MSGRIIPTILWKGWRFPGTEPLPTFWFFMVHLGTHSQVAQQVKNLPGSAGETGNKGSVPESGRFLGGNGNTLQYT